MQSARILWLAAVVTLGFVPMHATAETVEQHTYLRTAANSKHEKECEISILRGRGGWSILSTTGNDTKHLQLSVSYNTMDKLTGAIVSLKNGDTSQSVSLDLKNGEFSLHRKGEKPSVLDVPADAIVTSAPDWTDVFLLCKRYDRQRKGKQEFPGLWVHPTQPPLRLTFAIEQQGSAAIEHKGKKLELDRYSIRIRNNNHYYAWADAEGRMIRLMPAAAKSSTAGLTLQGFEMSAAGLKAAP